MAADSYDKLLLIELQKINGRLTVIEDQIKLVKKPLRSREYYLYRIIQLKIEKQALLAYTKELEKFDRLPTE